MNAGDKVRFIKGKSSGKTGIIEYSTFLTRPTDLNIKPLAMMKLPHEKCFAVRAEDGAYFFAFEDELELVK